jgi:uncharacterized protein YkwD
MKLIVACFILLSLSLFYQPTTHLADSGKIVLTKQLYKKQYIDSAKEAFDLINEVRTKGCTCGNKYWEPVQKLVWNDTIALAAFRHAEDMSKQNYFSHTGLDGSRPTQRLNRVGYKYGYAGENIAQGQETPEEVVNGWLGSEGHCTNIMSSNFSHSGIGRYANTWSQTFASPQRE